LQAKRSQSKTPVAGGISIITESLGYFANKVAAAAAYDEPAKQQGFLFCRFAQGRLCRKTEKCSCTLSGD